MNKNFKNLNDSQKYGLKHILTSKDNIIAIDGLAGVRKSTILNAAKYINGRKIINLFGIGNKFQEAAPRTSAAKTLKDDTNIQISTLHSFLYKYQDYIKVIGKINTLRNIRRDFSKAVIFVEDSSLISTHKMHELFLLRERLEFKLVLVGDQNN